MNNPPAKEIRCRAALAKAAGRRYNNRNRPRETRTMPNQLDKLTWNFILAVILTDCLLVFFIWREVFYRTEDTLMSTLVGLGMGLGISLSAGILYFSHAEVVRVIADRYLDRRFNQGKEVGKELGKEEGREEGLIKGRVEGKEEGLVEGLEKGLVKGRVEGQEENREHTREVLEKAGVELSPEVRKQLFGDQDQASGR